MVGGAKTTKTKTTKKKLVSITENKNRKVSVAQY